MKNKRRGTIEMAVAMVISGTIGWFVVESGQPIIDLLFWRCVFGAAFFYALAAIIAKKLIGTPPHMIALAQVCVGVVMLAPFANLSTLPTDARTWGSFVVMGVVYTGLVFVLLCGAIQKLPTHMAGALSFLYPIVAIVVDFVAFDHRHHLLQLFGVAAILLSAAGVHLGWSLKWSKAPAVD